MITLSPDQKNATDTLMDWYNTKDRAAYITLGGYAGTGKTTLIAIFRELLHKKNKKLKIAFVSYTGKAARVLDNMLTVTKAKHKQDFVGTIHSLMYSPITDDNDEIIGWERRDEVEYDLILIDEASMVDQEIWNDILSYKIPIVAVGDHGQLPPIRGNFNLMRDPMIKLEKIHRQQEDNPIIKVSIMAREKGIILPIEYNEHVKKFRRQSESTRESVEDLLSSYDEDTLVLCGYNATRIKLNQHIRNYKEFYDPHPQAGDRVICLRNNHTKQIYNGMQGTIQSIKQEDEDWYWAEIDFDGEGTNNKFEGLILADQFNTTEPMNFTRDRKKTLDGDLFDFGYALTVHKAQGSQAKRVVLFEQRFSRMDDDMWRRWLYTAVTRAQEELYIIG